MTAESAARAAARSFTLRDATAADAHTLWIWANDPDMRRAAGRTREIAWTEHVQWLRGQLAGDRGLIFIAETAASEPVGVIRFDTGDGWRTARLSYEVAPERRGRGIGGELVSAGVRALRERHPASTLVADVRADNAASLRIFDSAGWERAGREGDLVTFGLRSMPAPAAPARTHVIAASRPWYADFPARLEARTGDRFELITRADELTPERLAAITPRYVFFPHWSHRIPRAIHERYECIVFHMTDVPFGRGGSPLQNLIVRGHTETRISALRCVEALDAGPVYLRRPLALSGSAEEIFLRAAGVIEQMIHVIIREEPMPTPQEGEPVTFRRRTPAESDAGAAKTLDELYDHIRMLDAEGYPQAFLRCGAFTLRLTRAARRHGKLVADVEITMETAHEPG